MLDKITNNPFRVLGVYSNSRKSDIVRNVSKMNAFLAVGKNIDFTEDYSSVLGDIDRTQQMVKDANQELTLAKDRFSYALFWFAKNNEPDSNALSELQKGNIEKAITTLSSVNEPSSYLNLAVLYLIKEDYELAASIYSEICKPEILKSISDLICDDTFSISPEDAIVGVVLSLRTVVPTNLLLDYFKDSDYFVQIRSKSIEPSLQKAKSLINKAKDVDSSDPVASFTAGKKLMDASKEIIKEIKSVCGSDSSEFQSVSDNFAKQILQCGISYYNNSDDADKASRAKDLTEYALSISIGSLVKDRCQENCDIIKKSVNEQVPKDVIEEVLSVKECLSIFRDAPNIISSSITLLENVLPHLFSMKKKLGKSNSFYLKLSTQVAGSALNYIIKEVNEVQSELSEDNINYLVSEKMQEERPWSPLDQVRKLSYPHISFDRKELIWFEVRSSLMSDLRLTLESAWKAIKMIDKLDVESDFKKDRYLPNKSTLKNLISKTGASTSLNKYEYLDLYPLDEAFDFEGTLGKIEHFLYLITIIATPIVLMIRTISSSDSVFWGIIGGLIGGLFCGAVWGCILVYAVHIFVNIYTLIVNGIIWIINLFHKS